VTKSQLLAAVIHVSPTTSFERPHPGHTGSTAIPSSSARDDDDNDDDDSNDVTGYGPIGGGDGKNGKYDE
jgi:hypothetical protein